MILFLCQDMVSGNFSITPSSRGMCNFEGVFCSSIILVYTNYGIEASIEDSSEAHGIICSHGCCLSNGIHRVQALSDIPRRVSAQPPSEMGQLLTYQFLSVLLILDIDFVDEELLCTAQCKLILMHVILHIIECTHICS